jgi:hypothetical protein
LIREELEVASGQVCDDEMTGLFYRIQYECFCG